jgi:hypothetical protein
MFGTKNKKYPNPDDPEKNIYQNYKNSLDDTKLSKPN